VTVRVLLPETPLIVIVLVPTAALPLALNVKVLCELVLVGLNAADTPLGRPVALRLTALENPLSALILIVVGRLDDRVMLSAGGLALST
jgi:hypothetical protein